MRHRRALVLAAALALLAAACDGGDTAPGSPSGSPTAAPTSSSTPPSEPAPSTSPPPGSSPTTPVPAAGSVEVPSTVRLIDVRTGVAVTLFESRDQRAFATFDGDEVVVSAGEQRLRYRLDGSPVSGSRAPVSCRETNGAAEVGGRQYNGVRCGSISPDGRSMAYMVQTGEVEVGTSGYRVPQHDMWLVDLERGATTRLQVGLVHCGGCDARYGPRWSPSSRYVAYAEFGGEGRRFLSDVTIGTTRQIGNGNEISDAPEWSPSSDRIVYVTSAHGATARIEDLATGNVRDPGMAWPVRFDATGTFMYAPAWAAQPKSGSQPISTTIVEVATGRVVGTLSGAPPSEFLWTGASAVTRFGNSNGYLAVLQQAGGCDGTAIYGEGVPQPICVARGVQGQSSRDGFRVAVARGTGEVGPVHGPGFSSMSLPRFDVEVVNMVGGGSRTVVTGAVSFAPPLMLWDETGAYLLVVWPHAVGL